MGRLLSEWRRGRSPPLHGVLYLAALTSRWEIPHTDAKRTAMSTATITGARTQTTPATSPPMSSAPRYAAAGVDVDENDRLVERFRELGALATRPEMVSTIGSFGGVFVLQGFDAPMLVASTDGVGTKVMVARLAKRYDTVGADLVNHCINDILTTGAEPLFFLDYLAANGLHEDKKVEIVQGVAEACKAGGLALLGGETADMPNLYPKGEFDLAGTIVGVYQSGRGLSQAVPELGDVLVGLPSSGLHTNGYSLARDALGLTPPVGEDRETEAFNEKAFEQLHSDTPGLDVSLADALLEPHRSYWPLLRGHLGKVKALAHITGGGIAGNLERVLPDELGSTLDATSWPVPPIFRLIQRHGGISDREMFRVFNMGLGMIAVAAADDAEALVREIPDAARVGEVVNAGGRAGIERVRITGIGDPADA